MSKKQFDLFSIGRVSMDLFAQQIGAEFADVQGFDTSVGGSPVNIAIGVSRLGLRSGVLTAVGQDLAAQLALDGFEPLLSLLLPVHILSDLVFIQTNRTHAIAS